MRQPLLLLPVLAVAALLLWLALAADTSARSRHARTGTAASALPLPASRAAAPEPQPEDPAQAGTRPATGPGTLTGKVVDADGTPLEHARVTLHALFPGGQVRRLQFAVAVADEHGAFAIGLEHGRYLVFAAHGGQRSSQHRVAMPGAAPLELRVEPGPAQLRIVMQPEHSTVDWSAFRLERPGFPDECTADGLAGWIWDGLYVGDEVRWCVKAERDHFAANRNWGWHDPGHEVRTGYKVKIEDTHQEFVVRVGRFAWVTGRVEGPDGRIAAGGLSLRCEGGFRQSATVRGEYRLALMPGQAATLYGLGDAGLGLREPLPIEPLEGGESGEAPLRLQVLPGGVRLRVVDPDGRPAEGHRVMAAIGIGPHRVYRYASTDAAGGACLTGLPAGTCSVEIVRPNGAAWAAPLAMLVAVPEDGVVELGPVRLTRGGSIEVVVCLRDAPAAPVMIGATPVGADGAPVWRQVSTALCDADGSFRIDHLAAGRWRVRATSVAGVRPAQVDVDVADGGTARVVLDLSR